MNDDELYYWTELYPYKDDGFPFLFQVFKENTREEYYFTESSSSKYVLYIISNNEEFLSKKVISQTDILKVIKKSYAEFWSNNLCANPETRPKQFSASSYGKHTMYVAADYETIVRTLIATLAKLEYYCYSSDYDGAEHYNSDSYFDKKILDPEHFFTTSYLYKSEYNCGYPGCLITVDNLPLTISQLKNLDTPIYNWLCEKIEDIPCAVEFDYNFKSHFSFGTSVFDYFITPFYLELCRLKIKSVIFSVDNIAFYIKTNSYLDNKERLVQLDIYSGEIIDPERNIKLIEKAKKVLGHYWDELSTVSKRAFPVGLELYEICKIYNGNVLDSSPSSIQFAKLVEIEIEQKLLLPFRVYFEKSEFKESDIRNDLNDSNVSRMTKFLINPSSKAPELGTFAYFLSIVLNSKRRAETSPTIIAYKAHVNTFLNSEFFISKDFYNDLRIITTKYRNGSAHTKALPFSYLAEFYEMLIGLNKNGFIFKLLDALKKK